MSMVSLPHIRAFNPLNHRTSKRKLKSSTYIGKKPSKKSSRLPTLDTSATPQAKPKKSKPKKHKPRNLRKKKDRKRTSRRLVSRVLKLAKLEENVIIYGYCLLARALKKINKESKESSLKKKEAYLLFSTCLYLSIKCLVDHELWYLEDFARLAEVDPGTIEELEIFVSSEVLNFELLVKEEEFEYMKRNQGEFESLVFLF